MVNPITADYEAAASSQVRAPAAAPSQQDAAASESGANRESPSVVIEKLAAQRGDNSGGLRAASDAITSAQVAGAALQNAVSDTSRIEEVGLRAASRALSPAERGVLQGEAQQFRDELATRLEAANFPQLPNEPTPQAQASTPASVLAEQARALPVDLSSAESSQQTLDAVSGFAGSLQVRQAGYAELERSAVAAAEVSVGGENRSRSVTLDTPEAARDTSQQVQSQLQQGAGAAVQAQANVQAEVALQLLS